MKERNIVLFAGKGGMDMKPILFLVLAALMVGFPAGALGHANSRPQAVTDALHDLHGVLGEVVKDRSGLLETQADMETKLLGIDGRTQLDNRLDLDSDELAGCVNEAFDEIAYLKAHWKDLTNEEKAFVEQAQAEVRD